MEPAKIIKLLVDISDTLIGKILITVIVVVILLTQVKDDSDASNHTK